MAKRESHYFLLVTFVVSFMIGCRAQDNSFSDATCTSNDDCTTQRAECPEAVAGQTSRVCTCPLGSRKVDTMCFVEVMIGGMCNDDTSVCVDDGATCVSDGSNTGLMRCTCDPANKKVAVPTTADPNKFMCATPVMGMTGCETCESNQGVCYSTDSGATVGGCLCPVSRTGDNCDVLHVTVNCDLATSKMQVCYTPHDGVDTTQNFVVYTEGHMTDTLCNGRKLTAEESGCAANSFLLPLAIDKPAECGIVETDVELLKHRYEAKLYVNTAGMANPPNLVFNVFCTFQKGVNAMFNAIGAIGVPGNDQGQELVPTINMRVLNQINEVIPDGVALRLGDPIRFEIELTNEGSYKALSVVRCTASNNPDLSKPTAATVLVTDAGCPAAGQTLFSMENTWTLKTGTMNIIRTGLVPMFRMSSGSYVYLHCHLKLCIIGNEAECQLPTCTAAAPAAPAAPSSRRRKREAVASNIETDVTSRLIWYEDSTAQGQSGTIVENSAGYWALIICLAILAVLIIALVGFLIIRRGDAGKVGVWSEMRPQRFAMPRLGNEHVHI